MKTRTDHFAVICQIRRWLSFVKSLVKRTQHFQLKPTLDKEEEFSSIAEEAKANSIFRKMSTLYSMITDWIRDGMSFPFPCWLKK